MATGAVGETALRPRQRARRLALLALFEAEFPPQRAEAALERLLRDETVPGTVAAQARSIVAGVEDKRAALDAEIARWAPAIPVAELGRIERSILRSALFEVLYSAAVPSGTIRDSVSLARIYAGDAASRLVGGVLRSVTRPSVEGDKG